MDVERNNLEYVSDVDISDAPQMKTFFKLVLITSDNLGLNSILGFVESFFGLVFLSVLLNEQKIYPLELKNYSQTGVKEE